MLYLGAILTIGFTFFFGTENLRAQALMSAMLVLVISMALHVVIVVDHPFTGSVRVRPQALQAVQNAFADAARGGEGGDAFGVFLAALLRVHSGAGHRGGR